MKNKRGFTIAELTIALAVICVVSMGTFQLTASVITNTTRRRLDFIYKNECQNIITIFSESTIDSTLNGGGCNFIENLEYYLTKDPKPYTLTPIRDYKGDYALDAAGNIRYTITYNAIDMVDITGTVKSGDNLYSYKNDEFKSVLNGVKTLTIDIPYNNLMEYSTEDIVYTLRIIVGLTNNRCILTFDVFKGKTTKTVGGSEVALTNTELLDIIHFTDMEFCMWKAVS